MPQHWYVDNFFEPVKCIKNDYMPACQNNSLLTTILFTTRRYASAVLFAVIACPSVRLSVTSRYCIKTAKHRISKTTPHDSQWTLTLRRKRSLRNSDGIRPNWGR